MKRKWLANIFCLAIFVILQTTLNAATPKQEIQPKQKAKPIMHYVLGKAKNIYSLAFSPDDKRLLAGEGHAPNYQVVEWDIVTKKLCRKFDSGHAGQVVSINYSQSGRFFVIGHLDGFVSIRDRKDRVLLSFKSVENLRTSLCTVSICERNDPSVYTVVGNNIAQRRNITTGQTNIYDIPCDGGYQLQSAAATRDGDTFVCCSRKFLNIYRQGDFDSPQEIKSFSVFKNPCITDVAISDDSSMVMSCDYDGDLGLFDIKNDKLIKKWKVRDDRPIYTILPFHGRNWFATGNDTGEIKIWDEMGNLLILLKLKDENHPITALALTRDNRFLASSGECRPIVLWDLRTFLDKTSPKKKEKSRE